MDADDAAAMDPVPVRGAHTLCKRDDGRGRSAAVAVPRRRPSPNLTQVARATGKASVSGTWFVHDGRPCAPFYSAHSLLIVNAVVPDAIWGPVEYLGRPTSLLPPQVKRALVRVRRSALLSFAVYPDCLAQYRALQAGQLGWEDFLRDNVCHTVTVTPPRRAACTMVERCCLVLSP